jgi:transposase InsO family protein
MHKIIKIVLAIVREAFLSRAALHTEILALRQQVAVLKRRRPRPSLRMADRVFWVILSRLWLSWREALVIVKPETVIGWHRKGFRLWWTWKSRRGKPGRPPMSREVRDLIRRMSRENPLWGAPRIHGELMKLGIGVSEATVSKYMTRHPKPPSQTWRTFLENHVGSLASIDFFVVPTATFTLLFAFIVLQHERRRIVHIGVTAHPTTAWIAQQMREAFPWDTAPRYLIRDRDGVYGREFRTRLKGMGIEEVVTAPRSPWQSPFVERVIGSIRRECLDHVIVLNERQLRRILASYLDYYHGSRTHLSLGKDTPDGRPVQPVGTGKIVAFPQVGGLHHRYEPLAA